MRRYYFTVLQPFLFSVAYAYSIAQDEYHESLSAQRLYYGFLKGHSDGFLSSYRYYSDTLS